MAFSISRSCCIGPAAADELDIDAMSTDEAEVHEEVAEAVQAVRKDCLRDDLLGMVCPADWTIQAPEPLGDPNILLPVHKSYAISFTICTCIISSSQW